MEVSVTHWTIGSVINILWTIGVFLMLWHNHRRITRLERQE